MSRPEEFAVVDQWAAEAYLTALDAGEAVLLRLLDRGVKIHNWMWEQTKAQFPDLLPDSPEAEHGYNYKAAKQTVHGLNYGMEPAKGAKESGLPIHVAEWQYNHYHSTFPGIKLRQQRIRSEVENNRSATSLLGRKRLFFAPLSQKLLNLAYAWPSQSCIGEITNIALTRLMYWGRFGKPWCYPSLNTHDGIAIRSYIGEREPVTELIRKAFYIPITKGPLTIVIPVEIKWGPNFNDLDDATLLRYENVRA